MATLGSLIVELRTNAAQFERGLNQANARLGNIEKQAASAKRALGSMFAGIGVGLGFGAVVNEIAGFQKEMSVVRAVTGATGAGMEELTAKARELGASTAFSAAEAAQGMVALGQAGFSTDEILASIGDTLSLAAAGGLSLGEAADIASNNLSQFGMAADQTGRVADVLATAAASSNTTVAQMGAAMEYAGPEARKLGVSLEETAATIAVLSNAGIKGEKAGTGFRRVMASLVSPTGKAAEAINRLRIDLSNLSDVEGIFRQFARTGLSAADGMAIFGLQGAGIADILVNNVDLLGEMNLKFLDVAGSAERMAKVMQDNLAGDFKALSSAASELMLATGDAGLASGLRTATQAFTELLRVAGGGESFANISVQAQVMGVAIGALSTVIGVHLISALTRATYSTIALMTVLTAHPLVRVALVIGTVVSALMLMGDQLLTLGGVTGTVTEWISVAWEQTSSYVMGIATTAYDWVKEQLFSTGAATEGVTAEMGGFFAAAFAAITGSAATTINFLASLYIGLDGAVRAVARGIVASFTNAFSNVKNLAVAWGQSMIDVLSLRDFSFSAFQNALHKAFVEPSVTVANEIRAAFADAFSQDVLDVPKGLLDNVARGVAERQHLNARASVHGSLTETAAPVLLPRPPTPDSPTGSESTGSGGPRTATTSIANIPDPAANADMARLQAEANRIAATVQTPMDRYAADLARLIEVYETLDAEGNRLLSQEQFDAYLQHMNLTLEQASGKTQATMSQMTEFATQAARNMETAMSGFFFDVMQGKFDGFTMSFKQTIDRMVSDLLASQVMGFLMGDFGKNGNTEIGGFIGETALPWLTDLAGSFFGGARAYGGPVSPNSAYLVGERGPEMFVPNASGRIVPNGQMGGGVVVNMTVNTPDTAGFRRSQSQIASELAASISRGQRNL